MNNLEVIKDIKENKSKIKELESLISKLNPTQQQEREETKKNTNEHKISILEEGLKAVLNGDVQSLAYILYPEDFIDVKR